MPDVTMQEIGGRLRSRRVLMHQTAEEIAAQVPVNPSTYRSWENGENKISVIDLLKVARVLRVSTSYLLGEETEAMAEESAMLAVLRQLAPTQRRLAHRLLAALVAEAGDAAKEERQQA